MNIIKKIAGFAVATCMILPVVATAGLLGSDLIIQNNTNQYSTSKIRGMCSTQILGANGISDPHKPHTTTAVQLALACLGQANDCKAEVYMTNNCSGPKAADVVFSTSIGVKSFTVTDSRYSMSANGFYAQIDGGY